MKKFVVVFLCVFAAGVSFAKDEVYLLDDAIEIAGGEILEKVGRNARIFIDDFDTGEKASSSYIRDELEYILSNDDTVWVITRNSSDFERIMAEKRFQRSGYVDESTEADLANLLGANAIISGKIEQYRGKKRLVVRIFSMDGSVKSLRYYITDSAKETTAAKAQSEEKKKKAFSRENLNYTWAFDYAYGIYNNIHLTDPEDRSISNMCEFTENVALGFDFNKYFFNRGIVALGINLGIGAGYISGLLVDNFGEGEVANNTHGCDVKLGVGPMLTLKCVDKFHVYLTPGFRFDYIFTKTDIQGETVETNTPTFKFNFALGLNFFFSKKFGLDAGLAWSVGSGSMKYAVTYDGEKMVMKYDSDVAQSMHVKVGLCYKKVK